MMTTARGLTDEELPKELAKALRLKRKTKAQDIVYEFRRRDIFIPQKLYGWLVGTYPDIARRPFNPSWLDIKEAS